MHNNIDPDDVIVTPYTTHNYGGWSFKIFESVSLYHKPTGITVKSEVGVTSHRNMHLALVQLSEQILQYEEDLCWQEYEYKEA